MSIDNYSKIEYNIVTTVEIWRFSVRLAEAVGFLERNLMMEKILIKSVIDKKAKSILMAAVGIPLAIGVIMFFSLLTSVVKVGYYYPEYISGLEAAFKGDDLSLALFIVSCVFLLLSLIMFILYWSVSKCELSVTENNVKGKTMFGKEVVLPLYMVSAYSTRKLFSTIAIATSSGITKFALIGNYAEIGDVLSQKINERQESTVRQTNITPPQNNALEDIKKLKDLLDSGIITQEEFDAKKKQFLGL